MKFNTQSIKPRKQVDENRDEIFASKLEIYGEF